MKYLLTGIFESWTLFQSSYPFLNLKYFIMELKDWVGYKGKSFLHQILNFDYFINNVCFAAYLRLSYWRFRLLYTLYRFSLRAFWLRVLFFISNFAIELLNHILNLFYPTFFILFFHTFVEAYRNFHFLLYLICYSKKF